jgi:hypothetical protein
MFQTHYGSRNHILSSENAKAGLWFDLFHGFSEFAEWLELSLIVWILKHEDKLRNGKWYVISISDHNSIQFGTQQTS